VAATSGESLPGWCVRLVSELDESGARAAKLSKNPYLPLIRFTVGTGLLIMPAHERRHLLQAERSRHPLDSRIADR